MWMKKEEKKWIMVEFGAIHAVFVPHDLLAICTHNLVQFISHTLQISKLFIAALHLCQIWCNVSFVRQRQLNMHRTRSMKAELWILDLWFNKPAFHIKRKQLTCALVYFVCLQFCSIKRWHTISFDSFSDPATNASSIMQLGTMCFNTSVAWMPHL